MKFVKTCTLQSQLVSEGLMLKYLAPIEHLDSDVPSNTMLIPKLITNKYIIDSNACATLVPK